MAREKRELVRRHSLGRWLPSAVSFCTICEFMNSRRRLIALTISRGVPAGAGRL
jgi:hypothetical protein